MKKYIITLLAGTSLLFAGCGDDFLTLTPTDNIFEDEYYNSKERISNALTAAYAPLQWHDWAGGGYHLFNICGVMGGEMLPGGGSASEGDQLRRLMNFNTDPLNVPNQQWTVFLYSGVNRSNIVLERVDAIPDMTEAEKTRFKAEARALRAYYYKTLWRLWGNIPYYQQNLKEPFIATQYSADEVYAFIMEDLDFASTEGCLPESVDPTTAGHMIRAAAQMMRAEVILYQQDASRYASALEDMRSIIGSSNFDLHPDFEALFKDEGEWCRESILEVNYTDKGSRDWGAQLTVGGMIWPTLIGIDGLQYAPGQNAEFQTGWGFAPIKKEIYDLYDKNDQRRDKGILNFAKYQEDMKVVVNGVAYPKYTPRWDDTGYFLKKYLPRTGYNNHPSNPTMNYRNNLRLYRYAETLLFAAELKLRTAGNDFTTSSSDAEAVGWYNRILERAFGNASKNVSSVSLKNILDERMREFVGEGRSFWDIVRFGQAETRLTGYTPNKKFLPIPQSEIDKTNGTLKQNNY